MQRNPPRLKIPECDGAGLDRLSFSQRHGALINKKGGYYRAGKQYDSSLTETKTATRTTRLAAATSAKKDDRKGMDRGHEGTATLGRAAVASVLWLADVIVSDQTGLHDGSPAAPALGTGQ